MAPEGLAELRSEVAVLSAKHQRLEEDVHEMRLDVRRATDTLVGLSATMRTLRWVVGLVIPAGVALGVALVRLFLG